MPRRPAIPRLGLARTGAVKAGREVELKFGVDTDRAAEVAAALDAASATREQIESIYYDTVERRLAPARMSLRLRRTQDGWEQTLKAPGGGPLDRREDTRARGRRGKGPKPAPDVALHAKTRSGRRLARLLEAEGDSSLVAVSSTQIERRAVTVGDETTRVEVVYDHGAIRAGANSDEIREVEYELKAGDPGRLLELARAGVIRHGLWLSTVSKAARGERLERGAGPAESAQPPSLRRAMSGAEIARAAVAACYAQIAANQSELALGSSDGEHVHELRVGLRRARTLARELKAFDPRLAGPWQAAATRAFRDLGDVRDRDTVAVSLSKRLADAGSPDPALSTALPARVEPGTIVRTRSFQLALLDLLEIAVGVTVPTEAGTGDGRPAAGARRHIARRLGRLRKKVGAAAARFDELEPAQQHRVRKQLKRLRYLSELVATLFGRRKTERYIERLRPAQDALGAHVDLLAGLRFARSATAERPDASWFNVGWLEAQLPASTANCKKALRRAARAVPFWPDD